MNKIQLSKEIRRSHLLYYYKTVYPKLKGELGRKNLENGKNVPNGHYDFIGKCLKSIPRLAIGKPAQLVDFADYVKNTYRDVFSAIEDKNSTQYKNQLLELFCYDNFSKAGGKPKKSLTSLSPKKEIDKRTWGAYKFVLSLNLTVCPYCNRQHIGSIFTGEDGKARGDIDHFYPKSKYPYLSLSLYNMVPSCHVCNSALKGDEILSDELNPYTSDLDNVFEFKVDDPNPENFLLSIDPKAAKEDLCKELTTLFHLETLYQYHKVEVKELLLKREMYSDGYIHELYEKHGELFTGIDELRGVAFGYTPSKDLINSQVLAKMCRDLAKQLDIFKEDDSM